jgi:hypothetical protein
MNEAGVGPGSGVEQATTTTRAKARISLITYEDTGRFGRCQIDRVDR